MHNITCFTEFGWFLKLIHSPNPLPLLNPFRIFNCHAINWYLKRGSTHLYPCTYLVAIFMYFLTVRVTLTLFKQGPHKQSSPTPLTSIPFSNYHVIYWYLQRGSTHLNPHPWWQHFCLSPQSESYWHWGAQAPRRPPQSDLGGQYPGFTRPSSVGKHKTRQLQHRFFFQMDANKASTWSSQFSAHLPIK